MHPRKRFFLPSSNEKSLLFAVPLEPKQRQEHRRWHIKKIQNSTDARGQVATPWFVSRGHADMVTCMFLIVLGTLTERGHDAVMRFPTFCYARSRDTTMCASARSIAVTRGQYAVSAFFTNYKKEFSTNIVMDIILSCNETEITPETFPPPRFVASVEPFSADENKQIPYEVKKHNNAK